MWAEGEVRLLCLVLLVSPHSWNVGVNNWVEMSPEIRLVMYFLKYIDFFLH